MMVRDGAAGAGPLGPRPVSAPSRGERRASARGRAVAEFGGAAESALDVLELLELAWHDCYGEPAPPADVVEDVWVAAGGDLGRLAASARLAGTDRRDLHVAAGEARSRR
jgi:hypothetical protein